ERLQNLIWFSSASFSRDSFHAGGPRAGSGHGTRSKHSLEEGDHRGGPFSQQRVRVLQLVLHRSEKGWGVVSDLRSASAEPRSNASQAQDADTQSEDWFVTIDLKDTYFHISILPQHRKFLRFAFGGEAYQYRVLPFGLGLSPRTFTKCMDAALAPLQLQGIRILNYIDDWLILAQTVQMAVKHQDV
ncbi:hypothetical protein M9458_017191, partial [Cirrhinus mrigala]